MSNRNRLGRSTLLGYIRSRPFVTVPQLRWRFGLLETDEMAAVAGPVGACYVGLPERAAHLLQELWQEGRIEVECAVDFHAPLVLGAYALSSSIKEARPAPASLKPQDENDEVTTRLAS